jgi:starvation-inducible DNA-binding protein
MADALTVVSTDDAVDSGVNQVEAIADGLANALADTYRLLFKTHACHWNVEGPLFFSIHNLTEGQYKDMFEAADVIAERIRALGQLAPDTFQDMTERSSIRDQAGRLSAGQMCDELADDHEKVAQRLRALAETAAKGNDIVTEDLVTARCAFHEQAVWMLRALTKS